MMEYKAEGADLLSQIQEHTSQLHLTLEKKVESQFQRYAIPQDAAKIVNLPSGIVKAGSLASLDGNWGEP